MIKQENCVYRGKEMKITHINRYYNDNCKYKEKVANG